MWELEVSHNELREIPAFAFRGLDYALWELHLHHNKLTEVPAESIMVLEKLSLLNLSGEIFLCLPRLLVCKMLSNVAKSFARL